LATIQGKHNWKLSGTQQVQARMESTGENTFVTFKWFK